jgi:NADPH-dependent 2,4-dienoyl-CoA reductase/sulfur reductase-like enzyme/nitrite reductase/ring-hydroxylating ferredoxin subunit
MSTEHIVAGVDDLKDGQMKEVKLAEDTSILLVRVDGVYHAYGPRCPHHGAPLADGGLHRGGIRCPWHQAVFDATTGELREPPALDSLPKFDLRIEQGKVIVTLPEEPAAPRPPQMAGPDGASDGRTFAIAGSGAAGLAAAEALRQDGFTGRIVMLTREKHLPYDRTDLSKTYLAKADADAPLLRSADFFESCGIEIQSGREIAEVDASAKTIRCEDGSRLRYDRLLLASGAVPRRLGVPGEDLDGVLLLRGLDDCDRIRRRLSDVSRAVVVGASFIAMEAAAALTKRNIPVTVVAPEAVPFERVFGEAIGRMYRDAHERKGVAFMLGERIGSFEGDAALSAAILESGRRVEADLAVVGVGVRPATDYLKGIEANADGSITVDAHLQAAEDVYAAGDIARFPDWRTGEPIRIEHWRLAQQHGRVAAHNMAGRETEYAGVPFFWTSQYMVITEYVGYVRQWDEIVFDGDPSGKRFIACYVRDGRVFAAAGRNRERTMCAIAELLRASEPPTVDELRAQSAELTRTQEA